jgi:prevent-host-death family protein
MANHFTSREFNQDVARAKRASRDGPVIISARGRPAHVLLSYDDYKRLRGKAPSLADLISNPEVAAIDIEFPRIEGMGFKPVDFD